MNFLNACWFFKNQNVVNFLNVSLKASDKDKCKISFSDSFSVCVCVYM